jgi:peptidoglycan/xylan/chitin deacetylase (PgdA/CDA1 family)
MSEYQLPILLYHRIVNEQSKIGRHKIYVSEKKFREQMKFLKENGYITITFQNLASSIRPSPQGEGLGERPIILTFDDGYEDNYTILFPILKEFGFTAVIFLVTKLSCNEWGIKDGEPQLKMLTKEMIREMSDYGIEFGGHTRTHPNLKNVSEEKLMDEILGCKKDIEEITGKQCISFSYPYGAYNEKVLQAVQNAGYKYGITTIFGPKNISEDKMRIRRIEVRPNTTLFSFKRKVSGRYYKKSIYNLFSGK